MAIFITSVPSLRSGTDKLHLARRSLKRPGLEKKRGGPYAIGLGSADFKAAMDLSSASLPRLGMTGSSISAPNGRVRRDGDRSSSPALTCQMINIDIVTCDL